MVADPAGVSLEAYDVTEAPCGDDAHLATAVTSSRAFHAFCADPQGRTSVFVMATVEAEVEDDAESALK